MRRNKQNKPRARAQRCGGHVARLAALRQTHCEPVGRLAPFERADAQLQRELSRLRRQRNLFVLVLGAVLMVGSSALVRWAPGWADPAQVGLGAGGLYATVAVLLLRRR